MKGFVIFVVAAIAAVQAQVDESMIPASMKPHVDTCCKETGWELGDVLTTCMIMEDDDKKKCAPFICCMGFKMKFVEPDTYKANKDVAIKEFKEQAETLNIDCPEDEMIANAEPCLKDYEPCIGGAGSDEAKCLCLTDLHCCIVDKCVLPYM